MATGDPDEATVTAATLAALAGAIVAPPILLSPDQTLGADLGLGDPARRSAR